MRTRPEQEFDGLLLRLVVLAEKVGSRFVVDAQSHAAVPPATDMLHSQTIPAIGRHDDLVIERTLPCSSERVSDAATGQIFRLRAALGHQHFFSLKHLLHRLLLQSDGGFQRVVRSVKKLLGQGG